QDRRKMGDCWVSRAASHHDPLFPRSPQRSFFLCLGCALRLRLRGPMPVYAMLFHEYFGTRSIGAILGVFFMIASVGMGSGGLLGGVMYNLFGSYAVPFLTSTTIGLIAAFLALTLPASKKAESTVTPQMVLQPS